MPIFTKALQSIDPSNPQDAVKKMANHIKYLQEQLEYTLFNLDSRNINEIDVDNTDIKDSTGSIKIGTQINFTGKNGESFKAGINTKGQFEFSVSGAEGAQAMYINSSGELIITEHSKLTIDGGEW